ncbi:MAG: VOC family protein [Hyphomonadaceae bacterium]|nr:VOC family protein [Hyphomonadaceae bacterium]
MADETQKFAPGDALRAAFSAAMSAMYRREVPAYGELLELVQAVNADTLGAYPELKAQLERTGELDRLSAERHGAIRLGTGEELSFMRRIFALMGMFPVGYYDLTVAGLPVHATAFRPVSGDSLKANSFRIFCSLLRLDLISDEALRVDAADVLEKRDIFSDTLRTLVREAEAAGGVQVEEADAFIAAVLDVFRWRSEANVSAELYERFLSQHRLIADIVCFKGPHINHLTPRTLDIDAVQTGMPARGINPKAVIEGPPRRTCPILLRQTAFKALSEAVDFPDGDGTSTAGVHTARFGEIEQRGVALTPAGRALYDALLSRTRAEVMPAPDGSNAAAYAAALEKVFAEFPDRWAALHKQGLAYFTYHLTSAANPGKQTSLDALIETGHVELIPITYEDFLPVSAAGIFRSNLGDEQGESFTGEEMQAAFERLLGAPVLDPDTVYAELQQSSREACQAAIHARQTTGAT